MDGINGAEHHQHDQQLNNTATQQLNNYQHQIFTYPVF